MNNDRGDPLEEYPEFDVDDWSRLDFASMRPDRMMGFLDSCMKDREFRELMMHQYGSIVLGASKNLLTQAKDILHRLGRLESDMNTDTDDSET